VGLITDLRYGPFNGDAEPELAVVGTAGAVFVGSDHQVRKAVRFPVRISTPVILVLGKRDAAPSFLAEGFATYKVRLLDENGTLRWKYGYWCGIGGSAAGDLNGDGKIEVAVGLNAWGGIRLLDMEGKELWRKRDKGNIWHVEIVNAQGGEGGKIIHSNAGGLLSVRDGTGKELVTFGTPFHVASFGLARWGSESQARRIIVPGKDVIEVFDLSGYRTMELEAPGSRANEADRTTATPVCFSADRCYEATLVEDWVRKRSVLYLNDQAGKLSYQEIFDHRCAAVGTIPTAPGAKGQALLVGCTGEIWEYVDVRRPEVGSERGPALRSGGDRW
jgi:hypothetical protein